MAGLDTGWRFAVLALAWLVGVAAQLQQPALSPLPAYLIAVVSALPAGLLASRRRGAFVAGVMSALLLGFGLTGWRATLRLAETLPPALEGRDLQLVGTVASLPQRSSAGLRFRFEVQQSTLDGARVEVPPLIALGWYTGWHEDAVLSQPQRSLRAGQRWQFTARLRQPHGNLNPHGYDYELQLFEQGVRATGSVRDASPAAGGHAGSGAPLLLDAAAGHAIERLRQRVRDAIEAHVAEARPAGVLAALAVGDQAAIERDDWDLYRNTGIAHLMSISGLHVTMFAWLAGLAGSACWRRSTRAMLWLPLPQAARYIGLAAALAYALFSGWGVPAQRTVWMLAAVTLLQARGLRWPWMLVLLAAAVVVTALDPWALLQAGFWLSFAAVGLLMAAEPGASRTRDVAPAALSHWRRVCARTVTVMRELLRTQLVATLGLAPLTLVIFHQISLVGFLANLLAIPLVTLLITPLALLGVFAPPLWSVGAWLVQGLSAALAGLAALPGAVWTVPVAPAWAQLAGLLAAALLVMPLPWRLRLLALPLGLPLLMPTQALPPAGQFELQALDVGQGTSVLVRTHGHLLIYDAGPVYARDSDAGQRVLLPLLRARGETRIDRLLLSHRDSDHVGGAHALLAALPVGDVLSSLETGHSLLAQAASSTRCAAGQQWDWDGVHFEVLHPLAEASDRAVKPNALSCVLRVSGAGHSALLTGDIEREQESAMVLRNAASLRSEVLIVPHHGSKTSSSAALLAAVQPQLAVVQAGYRNRFGHPAADVMTRYHDAGIDVRASPACGAWVWLPGTEPAQAVCWRAAVRHYWHHDPAPP